MSLLRARWLGLVALIFIILGKSAFSKSLAEKRLVEALLDDSDYNMYARPVQDPSEALLVYIDILMKQIIDVDERQQLLSTKVWMRLWWQDVNLMWNPSDHSNISSVRIAGEKIWRPDITLYDDMLEVNYDPHVTAVVNFDGTVGWFYPTVLKSACQLNVYYFPWDQQVCELRFGSWSYDMTKLDVTNRSLPGNMNFFLPNEEWNVIGFPSRRHVALYTCCPEPYSDVTFYLIIRRKPLYHMFHLILPCIFLTATAILAFLLPVESGEKISLSVTVLLALVVFLLLVAETLPPQSESVPLLAQYFGAIIMLLSISTSLTVLVLHVHHRGSHGDPVPPVVQLVVLDWLAWILRMGKRNRDKRKGQLSTTEKSDAKDVAKSTLPETRIQRLASDCSTDTCFTELDDDIPTNNVAYGAVSNSLHQVDYVNEIVYPCRESAIFQQKSDARDMWNSASTETDTQIDEDEMAKWQMDDVEPNSSVTWQLDDKPTDSVVYEIGTNSLKQIRDMISHMQAPLKQICDTLFQTQQRQLSQDDADECRHSWMMVAMVLDRLLFVTFLLLTIIVSTVLLLNHPMYAYEHVDRPLDAMD